ncbi:phosphoglycerate kinase [Candidatus Acetothermia bacterium]|nr:phosphoglycerate kinase [Candidatus Acetothermia bacterium]
MLRRLENLDVHNKRVLVRVDFNVPLKDRKVSNDNRLRESLPTLRYLIEQGAKIILVSHLGRPGGKFLDELRMNPIAERLSALLGKPVRKVDECAGPSVHSAIAALKPGEVLLLENVRFYPGEEKNEEAFAQQLAELADVYVNDAFGTAHRAHASTYGVAKLLPSAAGFLLEREVTMLSRATLNPARPFLVIIGGAKISDKIGVMKDFLGKVDQFLVGGGSAFTFLRAKGWNVGKSIVDEKLVDGVKQFVKEAYQQKAEVILPQDFKIAPELKPGVERGFAPADKIPEGWVGLDLGPETIKDFRRRVREAKTIVWSGPLGAFETPPFDEGTRAIAQTILESPQLFAIIGGGDTAAAIEQAGSKNPPNIYISTGGGATLEFLGGRTLQPIEILKM